MYIFILEAYNIKQWFDGQLYPRVSAVRQSSVSVKLRRFELIIIIRSSNALTGSVKWSSVMSVRCFSQAEIMKRLVVWHSLVIIRNRISQVKINVQCFSQAETLKRLTIWHSLIIIKSNSALTASIKWRSALSIWQGASRNFSKL